MAEVMDVRQAQDFGKLLAQPDLHLVLGGINAVFGQPAGLDVAVQDDHFMPTLGDLLRGKHAGRSCANHENGLHLGSLQSSNACAQRYNLSLTIYYPLPSPLMLAQVS